jgi:NDP-mannose synthase
MADRVIVLAGGRGSRDVPYRTLVPKPLLPVGGRSVLELMLVELARHGFVDVTLAVGQLAPLIRALIGARAHARLRIRYPQDHEPLGAGGALALMAPEDPFLCWTEAR